MHTIKELFDLTGKTALITGGSRGLGLHLAEALGEQGAKLVISSRKQHELDEAIEHLKQRGIDAIAIAADLGQEQAPQTLAAASLKHLGHVDILINNAGIGDFGSIEEMPSETWEQVIKTNLFGVYYAAKAVYPFMKEKGEGDIVNVASTAGLKGGPNMSAYAASKAAVVSLSQSMMAEWRKQNIRVITLTPSTIASDMSIQGGLTDGNPDKVLQPEDFAEWVRDILKMNRRALIANGSIFSTNP